MSNEKIDYLMYLFDMDDSINPEIRDLTLDLISAYSKSNASLIIANEKIEKLSQWDKNKDTRNSRQRVANKKLIKSIKNHKHQIYLLRRYTLMILKAVQELSDSETLEFNDDLYIKSVELSNLMQEFWWNPYDELTIEASSLLRKDDNICENLK